MISALILGLFLVLMLLRVPVAISITLATMIGMVVGGYDLLSIPQFMSASVKSTVMLAVPFFILAANLMNALGVTQRIFDFAAALVGSIRGGLAHVNVVASMIFAGISGAAVADAAGLGTIEIRAMRNAGYPLDFSAAVTVASSTLGPIIPPSIMMLIYAVTANVSPADMFVAGLLPGVLIGAVLMVTIYIRVTIGLQPCPPPVPFTFRRLVSTAGHGVLSLVTPVIILWGMVSGAVTPTEAGAVAVFYALLLGLVYRTLVWRELWAALFDTIKTSSLILYIVAVSSAMSWVLVAEGTAHDVAQWLRSVTDNPYVMLVIANLFLLVLGAILETLPAMLIAVPVMLPAVDAVGIDRVHFGVVVVFNLLIGIMTPPMGIGLYIMVAVSRVNLGALIRACLPYMLTLIAALLVITFFPPLTLYLPELLLG